MRPRGIKAGELIHVIRIEKPSTSLDALGHPVGWVTYADDVRADVESVSGSESYELGRMLIGRMLDEVSHIVRIRFIEGIHSNMRVIWNGRILEIRSLLQPDGLNIEQRLLCSEVVP
jgi:SPP1 family predicted phage head-tail adaptor